MLMYLGVLSSKNMTHFPYNNILPRLLYSFNLNIAPTAQAKQQLSIADIKQSQFPTFNRLDSIRLAPSLQLTEENNLQESD